jgi:hypothetical protein
MPAGFPKVRRLVIVGGRCSPDTQHKELRPVRDQMNSHSCSSAFEKPGLD